MQELSDVILYDTQNIDDMTALYHKLTDAQKTTFVQLQQLINTNAENVHWNPLLELNKDTERLTVTHYHRVNSKKTEETYSKKFLITIAKNGTFINEEDPAFAFIQGIGKVS